MTEVESLSNHFLIAMPNLADPNFSKTVTLICEHSREGAMGLTINRQTDLSLKDILAQLDIEAADPSHLADSVYLGGPVQYNRGFVLHEPLGQWESTLPITDTLGLSTSRDILAAIAEGNGPEHYLITLGYAGWGPGQLEREMSENAWLSGPADNQIIFETAVEQRWRAAAEKLGVDLSKLSDQIGHA
ncbi:MAG: YqgE/AlgH family protein [Gammaproteobacteria bacterium]|nr:YqgE/AlgH family protein [Gammaproteobacteria bacterium]